MVFYSHREISKYNLIALWELFYTNKNTDEF